MTDTPPLPAAVRILLDSLPAAHRAALVDAFADVQDLAPADPLLVYRRGRLAGLIEAAELRGDLAISERATLLRFALGLGAPPVPLDPLEDGPALADRRAFEQAAAGEDFPLKTDGADYYDHRASAAYAWFLAGCKHARGPA